jgi:predicted NBD/HSP70 family sugar kinase
VTPEVALAFDLGGTRLKAGVVEIGTGTVVFEAEPVATPPAWVDAAALVEAAATELRTSHPAAGAAGLAMPGIIDDGVVRALPGKLFGAKGVDVAAWLAGGLAREGDPVVVVNDALAAGVGESSLGAGRGAARTVVITLGTGVGVSVVEDGRPVGAGPYGGGILGGQLPLGVAADARFQDTLGRSGTIEAHCRAYALVVHGVALGDDGGDAEADALAAYLDDVARAIAALTHAHAPDVVVVGGGVASGLEAKALADLQDDVNDRLSFGLRVQIRRAALGSAAALAGLGILLGSRP